MALLIPALLFGWSGGALATTGGEEEGTPSAEPTATIYVRQDPALGTILTDPEGMTLYLFTNDTTANESTCYDQCAENWPPFMAEEPFSLPFGVEGELTTVERTDGTTMVAYNGIPLYYFAGDTAPGDTNGQGVGDVWYVLGPEAQFGTVATPEPVMTGSMGTPQAGGDVEVTVLDGDVESSVTDFQVGETYTFNVTNIGQFPHEFVIEAAGAMDAPLDEGGTPTEIEPMDSGGTGTLTWTPTAAGIYQFACHVRTHYQMGMAVTIHVTE